jgi:hypothetical protein
MLLLDVHSIDLQAIILSGFALMNLNPRMLCPLLLVAGDGNMPGGAIL